MKSRFVRIGILILLPVFALAVALPTLAAGDSVEGDTIAWFRGDVEQAFAIAKEQNKPLFLYWGAVWCPYCSRIKSSVFESREFIALSDLFVPYYLDGDTEQAQAVGERFGVKGYPTMIVLTPDGQEVTRIPGGIDIDRYNSVLRNSLNSMRPTSELMAAAAADPSSLNAAEYTQLAYYSWDQDNEILQEDFDPEIFKRLSENALQVDEIASARLFMQFLEASSSRHSRESPVKLGDVDARIEEILRSDELALACWGSLAYSPEIMKILDISEDRSGQLEALWKERTMALRHHPSLTVVEQLAGWRPTLILHFEKTEDPISEQLARQLDADIARANESVRDPHARQGLVHQMKWTYQYAHMNDKARELMLAELDRSPSPYYFMSGLGSLDEEEGKHEEALEWYRKAWEISEGPATRFQWGTNYTRALIRLAPDHRDLIVSTADSVLDELATQDDVFSQRNLRRIRQLSDQMIAWQSGQEDKAAAQNFLARIDSLCQAEEEGSAEKLNCESLRLNAKKPQPGA